MAVAGSTEEVAHDRPERARYLAGCTAGSARRPASGAVLSAGSSEQAREADGYRRLCWCDCFDRAGTGGQCADFRLKFAPLHDAAELHSSELGGDVSQAWGGDR